MKRYEDCIEAMTKYLSCPAKEFHKSALTFRGKSLIAIGKKKDGKKDLENALKL